MISQSELRSMCDSTTITPSITCLPSPGQTGSIAITSPHELHGRQETVFPPGSSGHYESLMSPWSLRTWVLRGEGGGNQVLLAHLGPMVTVTEGGGGKCSQRNQCRSHSTPKLKMLDAGGGGQETYWEIDHIARLRDIDCRSK